MLPIWIPAIEARELNPPRFGRPAWISGASLTVVVYSRGMLKAMTSPARAPMRHPLRIRRRPSQSLRSSSGRSIPASAASAVRRGVLVSMRGYFERLAMVAAIVPIEAAEVARLMTAGRLNPLRSRFEGMMI